MHFFNPVDRMQLVEVIRGDKTSDRDRGHAGRPGQTARQEPDRRPRLSRLSRQPHSVPVHERSRWCCSRKGPTRGLIDKAAVAFGMPMGPITLNDLVGLDTALYAGRVVNTAFADRAKDTRILAELVKAGRLGQKTGAGLLQLCQGRKAADDPALADDSAKVPHGPANASSMEEITDRLFLPMLVEASLVLAEGIVRDPADVDMGLILGIGFPAFRGGILRWADTMGMDKVLARLGKYEALGKRFQPTEMMRQLAAEKRGFFG